MLDFENSSIYTHRSGISPQRRMSYEIPHYLAMAVAAALSLTACNTVTRDNFADFANHTGKYAVANDPSKNCYQDFGPGGDRHHVPTVRCPYAHSDFQGGF
jgi:putative hemolysin